MTARRLSLTDPKPTPVLVMAPARVSLAWWDGDEPVVVEGPNGLPSTVVIRWPTDEHGVLDRAALERGDVWALRWDITTTAWDDVAFYAARWNLREHDLILVGDRVRITARTLRSGECGADLPALVAKAVERLTGKAA